MIRRLQNLLFQAKTRIILIFVLCVILPSICFLGFFINSYSSYVLQSIIDEKQNIMKETIQNIDFQLKTYRNMTMSLYYNQSARSYIDSENYESRDLYVTQFLSGIVNSESNIASAILELDGQLYMEGYRYLNWAEYTGKYKETVLAKKGKPVWIPSEIMRASYNQRPKNFAMGRAINSPTQTVGTLWLLFSENFLKDNLKNPVFLAEGTEYYLISGSGQIVASSQEWRIGTADTGELFTQAAAQKDGSFPYEDPKTGEKDIIVCSSLGTNGWVLFTVTDERTVFQDVESIKGMAVGIACLYAAFLFLAYYILSTFLFRPMSRLTTGLRHVSEGNFSPIEETGRHDEMGLLLSSFNYMADEIQTLIENIRQEEKAKNDEKIKVLSMQIGPHFVYNTLNTIKWMAVANKQSNIKKMVESLVQLMMSVAYHSNEEISLKDEVKLLNSYVYIQKIRFMNFDIEYDLPQELENLRILKLVLQPFVENCILYAFKEMPGIGLIQVKFYESGNALYVEITDNGRGFDPSAQDHPREDREVDHVGIVNVRERVRLNYGAEYTVQIESKPFEGTRVRLRLPLIREETGND